MGRAPLWCLYPEGCVAVRLSVDGLGLRARLVWLLAGARQAPDEPTPGRQALPCPMRPMSLVLSSWGAPGGRGPSRSGAETWPGPGQRHRGAEGGAGRDL